MRIFVTGGTGFVGGPVIKELAKRGHRLLVLVRDQSEIKKIVEFSSVKTVLGDFTESKRYQPVLRQFRPQGALHLAWEGIPNDSLDVAMKNIAGGLEIFQSLRNAGCGKIIGVGSCREYGDPRGKVGEDASISPASPLYAAKTALFYLGYELFRKSKTDFVWVRPFYIYGPGQRPAALIPYVIASLQNGRKPKIKNKNSAHDFVFVDDIARALADLLEKHRRTQSRVYNIGSGKMIKVADVIAAVSGSAPLKPARAGGFFADISKIKKEIGWRPQVKLIDGIKRMAAFY